MTLPIFQNLQIKNKGVFYFIFKNKAITKVRAGKIIIKLNFNNNFCLAYRFFYI